MKTLIFNISILALVFFTVGSKLGSVNENYNTCLTENNASDDDMLTKQDVIHDRHKQSENQEKVKRNGCVIQCMLEKSGLMEGSEYDVEKMHSDFTNRTHVQPGDKRFEAMVNCVNETKDLTEKCDKSFALMECYIKAEEKIKSSFENHEGHEHEHEHESEK